jgi:hypothetical protein
MDLFRPTLLVEHAKLAAALVPQIMQHLDGVTL